MLAEFKKFAVKGNMLDMAVGIVIGGAFATIVSSLVADIITPPIGMLLNGVNFGDLFVVISEGTSAGPYATLAAAKEAGAVTLNYGNFINALISFLIVAWALFVVVRGFNAMRAKEEAAPPPPPPAPSNEEKLLAEIRDLLKAR